MSTKPRFPPALVLSGGVLAVSGSAILIRLAQTEASSLAIAAWRLTLATVLLLPLAARSRRREIAALSPTALGLAALSGALLGIHFATWISSLAFTSVASSTMLVATMPLWVALASPLVLREPVGHWVRLAILVALLGSLMIAVGDALDWRAGRLTSTLVAGGRRPLLGAILALAGAISGAGYILIGRRLRVTLSLLSYITLVYGSAAIFLILAALSAGVPLLGYTPRLYLLTLLMALFPQLLGHSSYNWALGYLPAAFVTITVISEPIGATVLALLFFGEVPGPIVLVGSALILSGLFLAGRDSLGSRQE